MAVIERLTPQALRNRIWRPRCRYRSVARLGAKSVSVFLLCMSMLSLVGYRILTDPNLLRERAITYLERATGGEVTIGRARVSLIDGIEFEDVTLRTIDNLQPVFRAKSLRMTSTIWTLLTRPYSETKILAIEPELFLIENLDSGQWNFQYLGSAMSSRNWTKVSKRSSGSVPSLPQVTMRGAMLHRYGLQHGKLELLGTLTLEGQFSPQSIEGNYNYQLSTRSRQGEIGPSLTGVIALEVGSGTTQLKNLDIATLLPFLPDQIVAFMNRLKPGGAVNADIAIFRKPDGSSGFEVTLAFNDGKLQIDPDYYFTADSDKPDAQSDLAPIEVTGGQCRIVFKEDSIEIVDLTGLLDTTTVELAARIGGYGLDAPLRATFKTSGNPIALRISDEQAGRLPEFVRNIYKMFKPKGEGHFEATMWRDTPGGRIDLVGATHFRNTQFTFVNFPYPVHNASGSLRLDLDESTGERQLILDHITGTGPTDSANAQAKVEINGMMAPLAEGSGINITIKGQDARGDELLVKCLPEGAQQVIAQFAPLGDDPLIEFFGDFETRVIRPRGFNVRWSFDTDIYLKRGRGVFKPLKVDVESARADIFVRSGLVDFKNVLVTSHGASATMDGQCLFRDPEDPEQSTVTRINFSGVQIAADGPHRAILPNEAQEVLKNLGVAGNVSITGPIKVVGDGRQIDYDFNLKLSEGSLSPIDRPIRYEKLSADVRVQPEKTELKSISAVRGESTLNASGIIHHTDSGLTYEVLGKLANLSVDDEVVRSIDAEPRERVESLKPAGIVDLDFRYMKDESAPSWMFDVYPRSLTITPAFCAVPFDLTSGFARIHSDSVELNDIVGRTGGTSLNISGTLKADQYLLSGRVSDVSIDSDFVRALPESLSQVTRTSARGLLDVELKSIDWRIDRSTEPSPTWLTVDARATLRGVSMDLGVTVSELVGELPVVVHAQNGKLTWIEGSLSAPTLLVAGLSAVDGKVKFTSAESAGLIMLNDIGFKLGGGEAAGAVTLDRSVENSVKYKGEMLLRDAEVKQLAADSGGREGRVSASLTFDGAVGQGAPRGRGDISVTGRDMVQVPMLIGLTQMVSLSLPFTSGFDQAQASYVFDGGVVNFENVTLQSREMSIRGTGQMDFQTRKLDMRFHTDSNTGKLPVIGSVLDAARRELFQINVRGTLSEPTIKTGMLPTIGTTIDEVLGED